MPRTSTVHAVTAIGIDMGKNTLHMVGLDSRGAVVLREKVSRGRIALRLANLPPCLIGIELIGLMSTTHAGSIRRECTDRLIVLNEEHLRRILGKFSTYYNVWRPHVSLGKDAPKGRPIESLEDIVAAS